MPTMETPGSPGAPRPAHSTATAPHTYWCAVHAMPQARRPNPHEKRKGLTAAAAAAEPAPRSLGGCAGGDLPSAACAMAVSYTHLTLPTILLV